MSGVDTPSAQNPHELSDAAPSPACPPEKHGQPDALELVIAFLESRFWFGAVLFAVLLAGLFYQLFKSL